MPTPRSGLASAVLEGKLFVAGGVGKDGTTALRTVDVFDPATGKWAPAAPMKARRANFALVALEGKRPVAMGGDVAGTPVDDVEIYDPRTDSWRKAEHGLTQARAGLVGLSTFTFVYAIGGRGDASGKEVKSTEVW